MRAAYGITGLPAGAYTLRFSAPIGNAFAAQRWHDAESKSEEATTIRVAAGRTVIDQTTELAAALVR